MDTPQPIEKRFIFHANAVAFAAHIRRPTDFQFKAVASSCLPVTGGLAEASSGAQNLDEKIRFTSASTSARGDFADTRRAVDFTHGNFGENELSTQTFVDARLNGLTIAIEQDHPPTTAGKTVTFIAEQLHARLESSSDRRTPVAFRGLEATIKGVSVDGHELIVTTAPEVCTQHETYDKLVKAYQDDGNFRKQFGGLFYPTGHEKTGVGAILTKASIPNAGGIILGTVVTSLKWANQPAPGTEIRGNRLIIEGIGSIFFGEILYEHNARRLTLLRFQIGTPLGGDGSACDVQSNGTPWPPQASQA
jgi:hypothetical protein